MAHIECLVAMHEVSNLHNCHVIFITYLSAAVKLILCQAHMITICLVLLVTMAESLEALRTAKSCKSTI